MRNRVLHLPLAEPPAGEPPKQVKIARAAQLLDYSEKTIDRLIRSGELVAVGSGRLRRVEYASIVAYIERHRDRAA